MPWPSLLRSRRSAAVRPVLTGIAVGLPRGPSDKAVAQPRRRSLQDSTTRRRGAIIRKCAG